MKTIKLFVRFDRVKPRLPDGQGYIDFIKRSDSSQSGFGLVEILVGAAIITIILVGLAGVGRITFRSVDGSSFKNRSGFLAEEGIEAVRTMRDSSWDQKIKNVVLNTDYYLAFSGGAWSLSLVHGPQVDAIFTRRVRFQAECRDSSDTIIDCPQGQTPDPDVKKVTVDVGWKDRGSSATSSMSTYVTNLFGN